MRKQTKAMKTLLEKHGAVDDLQATSAGVRNPRREAGLLRGREGLDVAIRKQTDRKREYRLLS